MLDVLERSGGGFGVVSRGPGKGLGRFFFGEVLEILERSWEGFGKVFERFWRGFLIAWRGL